MADPLLGSTVQVLLEKAINLASEQIGIFVGFKKDLEKLKESFTMIKAVLQDAEKKQVNQKSVKLWLKKLERVAFDAVNLLDDFDYEFLRRKVEIRNKMMRNVCFFFSFSSPIAFRIRMASKIQKINVDLKRINEEAKDFGLQSQNGAGDATALPPPSVFRKNRETDSVTIDSCFVGRDDDVSEIIRQLTATSDETVSVLPIVGMGGIGKTTLARKVFNDLKIEKHFDKRIWVCVSDDFDVNRLFGLILESLQVRKPEAESREAIVKQLKELLDGKKYLLVLDDVWNDQAWLWNDFLASLKGVSSAKGNCILVTTRKQQVATIMGISYSPCSLKKLSNTECWLILKENAFDSREVPDELQGIGFEIAQKCQGLPLAASVLGGMLRNKGRDGWLSTLKSELHNLGGDEDSVTEILKLSFDHLSSPSLKKCFAYCSIFSKDFEIERDQLIQLWAAEGFLHSNSRYNLEMEELGDMFFSILLDSNLLQDVVKDEYGNVLKCKMHDLVHDLVQSISKSKTLRLKDSTTVDDENFPIQFLAIETNREEIPFPLKESFRYITTLLFSEDRLINDSEISCFMCLRVLNLSSLDILQLPKSIGKLSHLRYLDSSNTFIETLPDSICELYNLQTLRVRNCGSLRGFPNNFKNLVNLRHFDFFTEDPSSDMMPLEIGRLNCLQTFPYFNIGKEECRQIGQLESLQNLRGSLEIRNLELVKRKEEAESANLTRKPNIYELRLSWLFNTGDNEEMNQVLEGLQPHQNVKGLIIENFFGDQLSTWIGRLGKLVKLKLRNCKNCKELPTLGHMPFLRSLELEGVDGITSIGSSFYGSQGAKKLFPALKRLILRCMMNLTEWMEVASHGMTVFPVLEKIEINNCPRLTTAPSHFPSLKELHVEGINHGLVITKICSRVSTLTSLFLKNVSGLSELPNGLLQNNSNLAQLSLRKCPDFVQFLGSDDHLVGLGSVEKLVIKACHGLKSISILSALVILEVNNCDRLTHLSIPQMFETSSSSNTCPVETLSVRGCPNLTSFPLYFNQTPSLSILRLLKCDKLTTFPKGELCYLTSLREVEIGRFSNTTQLHSFLHLFNGIQQPQDLPFLWNLSLSGWPHWESLPDQLQHLSALERLSLDGFGIKSLPYWFGKLSSLEDLYIYNCEKLEYLPSHQSMTSLTKLNILWTDSCPLLKERCSPQNGSGINSEWSKISHIPLFAADGLYYRFGLPY